MFKTLVGLCTATLLLTNLTSSAQVDTTYVYKTGMPYGTLDIRLAKSSTRYYYLQEGRTFSFRESAPGVKTNSFRDMTTWDSSPYTQGNLREKSGTSDFFIMNYRLLFPVSYNANYDDGYPLIIMMHGLGERGNCWNSDCYWADRAWKPNTNTPAAPTNSGEELLNNDHNLLHGGNVHLGMRNAAGARLPDDPTLPQRSFPGFVLFPQNLNGWDGGSIQDAIRLVRLVVKKYNINPDRIYIHGLSNGGAAVFDMIKRAPWLFSAAATMSAVSDAGIINQNLTSKVITIPLWMFQGGMDTSPSPSKTENYVKKFSEGGMSIRYTKYPQIGHGTWNTAYSEPDFFSWLRSHTKATVHVFGDNPNICGSTGVKLDLAEGFLAYQWQKNGANISGATGASYTATTPGVYRARFSRISKTPTEAQWNEWSAAVTIGTSNPTMAEVVQTGTVKLKGLDNYGNLRLGSKHTADQYFWYRNGVRLSNSTKDVIIGPGDCSSGTCVGNGVYTLETAQFGGCKSPESDPIYVFFNNQAPINITAPTSFTGSATSQSTATVNWTDASSNETGFEIWRRKQTGTTTFTPWFMATLTGANVKTFQDSGLDPSSTYQYKIRAVSNTGRSNYTPSASNAFLIINTSGDTQAPTVPQNLTATSTGIREITLQWQASTDNNGIREYNIYYGSTTVATGTAVTSYKLTNLALNSDFTFTVKAEDVGGMLSGASNAAQASTFVNGLYYEHSTGSFTDLDQVNWNFAEFTGAVNNFTLNPRTQDDFFTFEFNGYLHINAPGAYQFQTSSDDGSRMTLDNNVVVENDGTHGTRTVSGPIVTLNSGPRVINVKYFEATGGQNLTVRYKGPDTGNNWIVIPDAALRSGNSASSTMASTIEGMSANSTDESTGDLQLTLYPNPAAEGFDNITIQAIAGEDTPVIVRIVDFYGASYYEDEHNPDELLNGVKIEASGSLRKGLYVVFIQQDKRIERRILSVRD